MKIYQVDAFNDWGPVFASKRIKASSFRTASSRAASLAGKQTRKKGSKNLTLKIRFIGTISQSGEELLPADRYLPAEKL